MLVKDKQR